jgi:hypothetical protein
VDQNLRTPHIHNYNVNIEQQLTRRAVVQVGYVGSAGRKLFRFRDINQAVPTTAGPTLPVSDFNIINQFESTASSDYNALQATLRLRNFHGFTSTVNYNWSHAIDTASDGDDYVANAAQPDDSRNPDAEKANSNFDRRHSFTWDFVYELPGSERSKWLLSGWSLNGVLRLASGQPFHVVSFENFNETNEFFERPDLVGDPFAGTSTPFQFLNLGAFAAPCLWDPVAEFCVPGTGHPGSLRRNAFRGPSFHNFDFGVAKTTSLGERVKMQLRVDAFNIFNHPNFSNPLLPFFAVDLETNDAVQHNPANPTQGIGQGFLPITATPDVGIGNPFLGGGGPRNIQLAVRFTF